jgi:hypothetical protein
MTTASDKGLRCESTGWGAALANNGHEPNVSLVQAILAKHGDGLE